MSVIKRHKDLVEQIRKYDKHYYTLNESLVSDAIYDSLRNELIQIEKDNPKLVSLNSPTQYVGGELSRQFQPAKHPFPMLSLGNQFDTDELINWFKSISLNKCTVSCDLKLDGTSLELIYINGILDKAITRGDGLVGEDVTANAYQIIDIPRKLLGAFDNLLGTIIVRGEVVVDTTVFDKVNADRLANQLEPFINKRNYASGALRNKNPEDTKERQVRFIAYSIDNVPVVNWQTGLAFLKTLGFSVVPNFVLDQSKLLDKEYLGNFLNIKSEERNSLPFDIDGLVFKVEEINIRSELGFKTREPNWATAYKFPASEGVSQLLEVLNQVGRTGKITPVAKISPVYVHGTTITNVTLHNYEEIKRLGLQLNDHVVVKRAGDVIPKIVEVFKDLPNNNPIPIYPIDNCPCCYGRVKVMENKKENTMEYFCTNDQCEDQVLAHLEYVYSRDVFNIQGIGGATIKLLYDNGFKTKEDAAKIFSLTKENLISYGLSELMANKLYKEIAKRSEQPLDRVIMSLGIDGVAKGTANRLAEHYRDLALLTKATLNDLVSIPDIGPITAKSIVNFFNSEYKQHAVGNCCLYMEIVPPEEKQQTAISGKSIVITGSMFGNKTRKEITKDYEKQGVKVTSSVTSKTSLVICGTKYTEHKLQAAKDNNIPFIVYDENGIKEEG